jgi:hypothetical protein
MVGNIGETGALVIKLGTSEPSIHSPLPHDSPIHNLVGRIAANWSQVEHLLDLIIWQLARLDDPTGACLTGQIIGSFGRIYAIKALCIHRGLSVSVLDQVGILGKNLKGIQDRRNRILHDPWYFEIATQQTEQYKSMARDEFLSGFYKVDEAYLQKTLASIGRRIDMVGALRNAINAEL